jgi:hypothetical protein
VLDSETREISVPDLTSAQALLGTRSVLRARTAREFQQLRADADAGADRGPRVQPDRASAGPRAGLRPGGTAPSLSVHLLNRAGSAMNELKAEASPRPGEQQIDLPLAGLPPGEYVLEIKTGDAHRTGRLPRHRLTVHARHRRGAAGLPQGSPTPAFPASSPSTSR